MCLYHAYKNLLILTNLLFRLSVFPVFMSYFHQVAAFPTYHMRRRQHTLPCLSFLFLCEFSSYIRSLSIVVRSFLRVIRQEVGLYVSTDINSWRDSGEIDAMHKPLIAPSHNPSKRLEYQFIDIS